MKTTAAIIKRAFDKYRPAIAYSGGGDSTVLLDIVCGMGYRPPLIYVDSQMEYTDGLPFVQEVAERYGCALHVGRSRLTPLECWKKYGYPMMGKGSARIWMRSHAGYGFKIDCSTCCRHMKLAPGRAKLKEIGCNATLTGLRGQEDSAIRGLRAIKDGAFCFVKADSITQINPLLGWTDLMIRRYTENHGLPVDPKKRAGLVTAGCMYCGGGAQFDNSAFRVLRHADPVAFRRMLKEFDFAPVILAIRFDVHIDVARDAIQRLGGIDAVIETMPHVFDFLRPIPLKGYVR